MILKVQGQGKLVACFEVLFETDQHNMITARLEFYFAICGKRNGILLDHFHRTISFHLAQVKFYNSGHLRRSADQDIDFGGVVVQQHIRRAIAVFHCRARPKIVGFNACAIDVFFGCGGHLHFAATCA